MAGRTLPMLDAAPAALPPSRQARGPVLADPALAEFATDDVALPSFHVWTLGCQMNRSDSEEMAGALLAAGCAEAPSLESAELIVINTCAIREAAEQKVIGRMGHLASLKAANPHLRVVLTGCSVRENNRDVLQRRYPAVDLFLTPDQEPELAARLGLATATAPGRMSVGPRRESASHAWLPIIYGCDKSCTYCIVPFSRGRERSRPFDEVVEEARRLAAAGYREVTLLGQNVNSYGHDLPAEERFSDVRRQRELGRRLELDGRPDIAALLRAIDGIRTADGVPAIPRLRFVTSHPWDLGPRLISAMAECTSVCEHLHLPVQSGDDAVLRRMGRQYTRSEYLELVGRLREQVPGIVLTTDVIVGFCGETEAQFERTLELLREVRFEQVFAAAFSVRPGTPAARLADDVPREEKKRRLQALLDLQEGIGLEANSRWSGAPLRSSWTSSASRPDTTTAATGPRVSPAATPRTSWFTSTAAQSWSAGWSTCVSSGPGHMPSSAARSSDAGGGEQAHPPLLVICGPTATGKTALSLALAERLPGAEIISADSRQVYRGMDIGTAKVSAAERGRVPHHGLDLVEPSERFTVADYVAHTDAVLAAIAGRGGVALLVGGTGLYVRAVGRGVPIGETGSDPEVRAGLETQLAGEGLHTLVARLRSQAPRVAARTDLANPRRVVRALERVEVLGDQPPPTPRGYPGPIAWLGLDVERETNDRWIAERARWQFENGLLEEAAALRERFDPGLPAFTALGYPEAFAVLDGRLTLEQAIETDARRTRQFARRQRAWFRSEGDVEWLDATAEPLPRALSAAARLLEAGS